MPERDATVASRLRAAGGSAFDVGSDTGGSIRLPAHFCGVAGIKPTSGRVPRTGHSPAFEGILERLTQLGPIARYVEDLDLLLPIISGIDWRDPSIVPMPLHEARAVDVSGLRVAFHVDNGIAPPTPEIAAVARDVARLLEDAGAAVEETLPAGIERTREISDKLYGDGGDSVRRWLRAAGTKEPHSFLDWAFASPALSTAEFVVGLEEWDLFRSDMLAFMEDYDAILCPVNAQPAMPHGEAHQQENFGAFSYTETYNLTGWPGGVVRAGATQEGLPIGVQVVARPWREDVVLALLRVIEEARGGWQPPTI